MKTNGGFLITQIKQVQGRVFEKLLHKAGIDAFNGAQGRILYVLWQEDGLPIRELAKQTGLAKTTLTSMLDRMERDGFILRRASVSDRRQTDILLTDQARAHHDTYEAVSQEMNTIFYRGFSEEEIEQLESQLKRIVRNLEEF